MVRIEMMDLLKAYRFTPCEDGKTFFWATGSTVWGHAVYITPTADGLVKLKHEHWNYDCEDNLVADMHFEGTCNEQKAWEYLKREMPKCFWDR